MDDFSVRQVDFGTSNIQRADMLVQNWLDLRLLAMENVTNGHVVR